MAKIKELEIKGDLTQALYDLAYVSFTFLLISLLRKLSARC